VSELKSPGKPFEISKVEVWQAWEKVRSKEGAPGVDGCSIEDFEADLKNNLYKIWNRMSSGSYFPPPVRAVEIPKPHGGGTRILGVPTGIAICWFVQAVFGFAGGDVSVPSAGGPFVGDLVLEAARWRLGSGV
jgi:hypothetical protein